MFLNHFFLLNKTILYWVNILYNRPVQRAQTQKKCVTFNYDVVFIFDLTLDVTK